MINAPLLYTAKRSPSVQSLIKSFGFTLAEAKHVKGLLTGKVDVFSSERAVRRDQAAFNRHADYVLVLEALDEAFGSRTYGAEYLAHVRDTYRSSYGIEYLNAGDGYEATIYYNHLTDTWGIGCWADFVERYPNRYI